jgi:hypothetical protein
VTSGVISPVTSPPSTRSNTREPASEAEVVQAADVALQVHLMARRSRKLPETCGAGCEADQPAAARWGGAGDWCRPAPPKGGPGVTPAWRQGCSEVHACTGCEGA